MLGSRPRKALKDSMAGRLPPASKIACRYFFAGGRVGRALGVGAFFKSCVGVCAEHFGPFVAVVARRVTPGKNMAKGVYRAVEFRAG
jgi:hypothetical protein